MADFVFGDFSEQETEKFFGHDKQSMKINEPEFPWATDDCVTTAIEFGFDVPSVISPSGVGTNTYPNFTSCNGSSSHQESTSSALTSPPYSSKSSSVENLKITKQSSSHNHHHNDKKLKKKRPPNYYRQEYQQMLEPSTLHTQQTNGQSDEATPTQIRSNEQTPQIEQSSNESNLLVLSSNDNRYISCDQWVHSTMQHQMTNDDDQSSSKQSTNDDDELDSDGVGTTTDTDNDNELLQTVSTTRPSYPVNIIPTDHQSEDKSNHTSTQNLLSTPNQVTNDLNIYSTSVASGASIETLKPSNNQSSPLSSPNKQNDLPKSKPVSWADLFRSQTTSSSTLSNTQSSLPQQSQPATSPIKKPQTISTPCTTTPTISGTQISTTLPQQQQQQQQSTQQNGAVPTKSNANNFHSKSNYHVYNSNGLESKSLEDYFSKCEVRPSAMAIKPRGLINKNNYCYINATFQALLACPAFFNVMKYIPLNEDPIDHNVPCIKAVHSFVNQFEKMDRSKSNSANHKDIICGPAFDPVDVIQEIARLRHVPLDIVKTKQEDAHELLCQLLSELHDEICSVLYNTTIKNDESSLTSEVTTATTTTTTTTTLAPNGEEKSEDWLQVGKRNRTHILRTNEIRKSLIADIFAGKFRSTVHVAGNQKSVTHESFFTLSLDIKDPKITSLDEALIRFCEQSAVSDYIDSKTRQNVHTNKTMLIEQLPPILIIHLKCFLYDESDGTKKVNKSINYTVNLTLPKSILTEQARKHSHERFKLFAVEYHRGERATDGHYITDVFHPGLQGWLRYDDAQVTVVTSSQVMNSSAEKLMPYLLFYRRGD